MAKFKRLSLEERNAIVSDYQNSTLNLNLSKLSQKYDRSMSTIKNILTEAGIELYIKPKKFSEDLVKNIIKDYKLTGAKNTAKKHNIDRKSVWYILKKYNTRVRRRTVRPSKESVLRRTLKVREQNLQNPTKRLNQNGYIIIQNPKRFDSDNEPTTVLEHRYIMEQHLGRKLLRNEHVHHINGIKTDNRLENLTVRISTNHFGKAECPKCKYCFQIR